MTDALPFENRTRVDWELGLSPSPPSSTPAFPISSMYLPIASRSSVLGITPASVLASAFLKIMNRIV